MRIYPVIHVHDLDQVSEQVEVARRHPISGVFLIDHDADDIRLAVFLSTPSGPTTPAAPSTATTTSSVHSTQHENEPDGPDCTSAASPSNTKLPSQNPIFPAWANSHAATSISPPPPDPAQD